MGESSTAECHLLHSGFELVALKQLSSTKLGRCRKVIGVAEETNVGSSHQLFYLPFWEVDVIGRMHAGRYPSGTTDYGRLNFRTK